MALDPRISSRVMRYRRVAAGALYAASKKVAVGPAPWQLRSIVGGRWDEIGKQQFDFVKSRGLEPHHRFIDLGCGVLRGGVNFIDYLDTGNYYGIDLNPDMIAGARAELQRSGLVAKQPTLRVTDSFDVDFGVKFEYGIALSVFTHVPWNSWFLALANLSANMAPNGRFFATFFPGPEGPERFTPIVQQIVAPATNPVTTYGDRNDYHFAPSDFSKVADTVGLDVELIGDWGHLRGQHMLCFTKSA